MFPNWNQEKNNWEAKHRNIVNVVYLQYHLSKTVNLPDPEYIVCVIFIRTAVQLQNLVIYIKKYKLMVVGWLQLINLGN